MKITKKNAVNVSKLAAAALAGVMVIGGASAYLTDAEVATNTFTVGKVQVDLTEPKYPGNDTDTVKNLIPNQEVAKDPTVTNTGNNNAIVFLKVKVPKASVVTANPDGTRAAEDSKVLFYLKDENDQPWTQANNFDVNWVRLTNLENETNKNVDDSYTYIFGYNDVLQPGVSTTALFDKVQLINVIEGEIDSSTQDIDISAYAIQDDNILTDTSEIDLTTLNAATLEKVYNVFVAQNSDAIAADTLKDADTNNKLDLGGTDR